MSSKFYVTRNMFAILLGIIFIKGNLLAVLSIVFYFIRNVPVILSILHLASQKLMLALQSGVFCFTEIYLLFLQVSFLPQKSTCYFVRCIYIKRRVPIIFSSTSSIVISVDVNKISPWEQVRCQYYYGQRIYQDSNYCMKVSLQKFSSEVKLLIFVFFLLISFAFLLLLHTFIF